MDSEGVVEKTVQKSTEDSDESYNVVHSPDEDITDLVEEYWKKESNQNILGNNSKDIRLIDWAEYFYGIGSLSTFLVNPLAGITMAGGYAIYKADSIRRSHKKRKRIDEIENKIDDRYFFDESADLSPIISETDEFEGVGGSEKYLELYQFVLDEAEEIPVEAEIDGYFKNTSQILWMDRREDNSFDYSIEMLYDGIPLFEINGYAEGDFSDILEDSQNPSKSRLIFDYTEATRIGSEDAIAQVKNIKERLIS